MLATGRARIIHVQTLKHWFAHHKGMQRRILSFAHALFTQVVQTSACNRFHPIEQRLSRALLIAQDRLNAGALPFTHENLSRLLGADRVSITRAARKMKETGLIDYTRGRVTIINRDALDAASCECYGVIKPEYDDLLSPRFS